MTGGLFNPEAFEQMPGQMSMEQDEATEAPARLTYRERRELKAERLQEWSGKREAAGAAAYERSRQIADRIPFGQPILVGHHSERGHRADIKRIDRAMSASVENSSKAAEMASRADEIDRQAKHAIYSDDPDAIERLTAKIAKLEAERGAIKARNAEYRKTHRVELKAMSAYQRDRAMPYPGYHLTNLTGNLSRLRQRLQQLERERDRGPVDRMIFARFASECAKCGSKIERGDRIAYNKRDGARCLECAS